MKRIYEVTVTSDRETAEETYRVLRENVTEAAKAALRAYRRCPTLMGRVRVRKVIETGAIDA